MKRTIIWALCLSLALSLLLCACGKEAQPEPEVSETRPPELAIPEIDPDYIYLASESVFLDQLTSDRLRIMLISASQLSKEDLEVSLDGRVLDSQHFSLGYMWAVDQDFRMPFYVYQMYRGKNWAEYAETELAYQKTYEHSDFDSIGERDQAAEKLQACRDEFRSDYEALSAQGRLPTLYDYSLQLGPLDETYFTSGEITEITLSVKGKTHTFPVGQLHYKPVDIIPYMGTGLVSRGGIGGYHVVYVNAKGEFPETDGAWSCPFQAEEDISITDIYLWEDDREISDVQVVIANAQGDEDPRDGTASVVADYIWDRKSPIELSKGQFIYFNFVFHDPTLANVIWGHTEYNLTVAYRDRKGNTYLDAAWYPTTISTPGANPHEIYLAHELGIDVMSYYTDFYYPVNDSLGGFMDVAASN